MRDLRALLVVFSLILPTFAMADPIVSPPRDIGDFPLMQAVWDQSGPEAVSNGEDYLVVYVHGTRGRFLRATRITANGDVLDPFGIAIGSTGSSLHPFDVLWSGSEYLIAWTRSNCDDGGSCLQFTTVTPDGEVEQGMSLPPVEEARFALRSGVLLVAWSEPDRLQARMIPLGGEPGEPIDLLDVVDRYVSIEKVVATSSGFLVFAHAGATRTGSAAKEQLLVIPVDASGNAGAAHVLLEGGADLEPLRFGSISTTGQTTAVLFGAGSASRSLAILGPSGEDLVRLDPFTAFVPDDTLLLPDGEDFLMASRQAETVVIQTLGSSGATGPVWTLQPGIDRNQSLSAFAGTPSTLLLVREERKGDGWSEPGGLNQIVRTWDRALEPLAPASPLMLSAPVQRSSAVAAAGDTVLHVWDEYRDGIWQLYSQPMSADGQATAWPVDHPYNRQGFSLTSDGETFLLATGRSSWTPEEGWKRFVELTTIARDGSVVARTEIANAVQPEIVFDGKHFVLLWWERLEGRYPDVAMLTVLDDSMEPGTTIEIGDYLHAAGFDGGVYILGVIEGERLYPDLPPTRGLDVRVASTAGAVSIGPRTVVIEPSVNPVRDVRHETITSNRMDALIYWQQAESDGGPWGYREESALVNRDGNVVAETPALLEQSGDTAAGMMTWDGRNFVSANMGEHGDRLLVQYLDRRGRFGERLRIPVDSYGNAEVSITSVGDGRTVVDDSAFVTDPRVGIDVERVFTQEITKETERRRSVRRP